MATTALSLCSQALVKIGANGIVSFNENTAEAEVASYLYSSVRDALLSSYPWRFATTQSQLVRFATTPQTDYQYSFALPKDFLRALSLGTVYKGYGTDYRICENELQTNQKDVILTYIFRPQEEMFPAFFAEALVSKLAAEFCLPLTESTSRAEYLNKRAQTDISSARLIDAQQAMPKVIDDFSLIGVRQ